MNKLILGTMLAVGLALAGPCDGYIKNENMLNDYDAPLYTGTYKYTSKDERFIDGSIISIGSWIMKSTWQIPSLNTSCKVKYKEQKNYYDENKQDWDVCYIFTVDCEVENKTQFIDNIKWHTKVGYRKDGTLKWSRAQSGSTDINCYDKNGMAVIKRVNDPYFCK